MPKSSMEITTVTKYHFSYTGKDLIEALDLPKDVRINVFVSIPGGGDYCNEDLEIDNDCTVNFTWERIEHD